MSNLDKHVGEKGWAGCRWNSQRKEIFRSTAVFKNYEDARQTYPVTNIREFTFDGSKWLLENPYNNTMKAVL